MHLHYANPIATSFLIFAAGANDYTYRLSSICLRIPVVKIEHGFALDDSKLGSIGIISE